MVPVGGGVRRLVALVRVFADHVACMERVGGAMHVGDNAELPHKYYAEKGQGEDSCALVTAE